MSDDWRRFVRGFVEEHLSAHPDLAVRVGRHEHDGRFPDWSEAGLRRELRRLREARRAAASFGAGADGGGSDGEGAPRGRLGAGEVFEREHLLAVLDREIFWREEARWPTTNPLFYGGALSPEVYLYRDYAPLRDRMEAFTEYAERLPGAAAQIRENLTPPLPETYLDVGRTLVGGLADHFREDVPGLFAPVDDPELGRRFRAALEPAAAALDELEAWMARQEEDATQDFRLGEDRMRGMLWATERVDAPLEHLESVARQDLEANRAALEEACARLAPDATTEEAIRRVQARKPSPSPVDVAREQVERLRARVEGDGLLTIPSAGRAEVAETPPYLRWNAAQIEIPGAFEEHLPAVLYISPPDAGWSEEERDAYLPSVADLFFIAAHEVWPGHYLQFLRAHECDSLVGRIFVGYGFAEGWAHYSEELAWEAAGSEGAVEREISLRLNALLRDVRFVTALRMHAGEMSLTEAEDLFTDLAFQDAASARQQAARGTFDPGYLAYTMGKIMISRLRSDWLSEGEDRDLRAFHDRFLSFGSPPIPLVRRAMLREDGAPI